jgi:hypothetical protein
MKILASILALLLTSSAAGSAVRLDFSGHFESILPSPLGISQGSSLNANDSFTGQFTFNADTPNQTGYQFPPSIPDGALLSDTAISYFYSFNQNQSASVAINNGQPLINSAPVEVLITDNSENFMSGPIYDQNGNAIGERLSSTDAFVPSSIYDVVSLGTSPQIPALAVIPDPSNLFPSPTDMTIFRISALFAADTFSLDGVNAPSQQNILGLPQPLFLVFQFSQITNSQFTDGAGLLERYNLSEVPLPGTVWLFGSILMGWRLSRRQEA